jgi:hypothetical protein
MLYFPTLFIIVAPFLNRFVLYEMAMNSI